MVSQAQLRLELALLPLQQFFPQRLKQLLLMRKSGLGFWCWSFLPLGVLLILQVLGPQIRTSTSSGDSSSVVLPSTSSAQMMEKQSVTLLPGSWTISPSASSPFQFLPLLQEAQSPFHQLVVKFLQDYCVCLSWVQRQLETPLPVLELQESLVLFLRQEVPLPALEQQLKQVDGGCNSRWAGEVASISAILLLVI